MSKSAGQTELDAFDDDSDDGQKKPQNELVAFLERAPPDVAFARVATWWARAVEHGAEEAHSR